MPTSPHIRLSRPSPPQGETFPPSGLTRLPCYLAATHTVPYSPVPLAVAERPVPTPACLPRPRPKRPLITPDSHPRSTCLALSPLAGRLACLLCLLCACLFPRLRPVPTARRPRLPHDCSPDPRPSRHRPGCRGWLCCVCYTVAPLSARQPGSDHSTPPARLIVSLQLRRLRLPRIRSSSLRYVTVPGASPAVPRGDLPCSALPAVRWQSLRGDAPPSYARPGRWADDHVICRGIGAAQVVFDRPPKIHSQPCADWCDGRLADHVQDCTSIRPIPRYSRHIHDPSRPTRVFSRLIALPKELTPLALLGLAFE